MVARQKGRVSYEHMVRRPRSASVGKGAPRRLKGLVPHPLVRLLQQRRVEMKMSQDHLGKVLGSCASTISDIERGDQSPTLSFLDRLASRLGFDIKLVPK
jgi:DNA-binding XRE family transcriptional regulator